MAEAWTREFAGRMRTYGLTRPTGPDQRAVSIKVRVTSGCFHREHSPNAYRMLDQYMDRSGPDTEKYFDFVEHESGPEILVYVAATTAGITLAKSIVDLVVAVLKARSNGVKSGDKPSDPVELIVRRSIDEGRVDEEVILRIGHHDPVEPAQVERSLVEGLERLLRDRHNHDRTG